MRNKKEEKSPSVIHNATLFGLPPKGSWDIKYWQSVVRNNLPTKPKDPVFRILTFAEKIEDYVRTNRQALEASLRPEVQAKVFSDAKKQYQEEYQALLKNQL